MGPTLLVCISRNGVSVALWRGRLASTYRYPQTTEGEADFADLLEVTGRVPVRVMVDSVEEDYRFETLPHAVGRDRREMVGRKLRQIYRTSPYATASIQERERAARKDDRYLFSAITDTEFVDPWIAILQSKDMPIAGVFPLPTVMPAAVAPLRLRSADLLLVSRTSAGLRQTFLKNGQFRFSRLTPFRGHADDTQSTSFATEIVNTRLYLNALQVTLGDDVVDVVLLDPDDTLAELQRTLATHPGAIRVQRLARTALTSRLKMADDALSATPDSIPLQLLGLSVPKENLAPSSMRQGYMVHRAARWLLFASGAVAVIAAGWFMADLHRIRDADSEAARTAQETTRYQSLYAELTRQFPRAPVGSAVLKQTVDAFERLRATARTPESLFAAVSAGLEGHPSVRLNALAWRHSRFADTAAAFSDAGGLAVPAGTPLRQAGRIEAEIQPFNGDYRLAVGTIRAFAETLKRHPAVADVRILKMPLDDSSKQNLSGSTATRAENTVGAQFEVVFVLRDGGAP